MNRNVLVTGGAGYVGSVLVPEMLARGYNVRVVDLYIYGNTIQEHENLEQIKGDIRNTPLLKRAVLGCDTVIHLACISNDPSFELNPELGRSINYEAFTPLVEIAKANGVHRFIYASSSSVYGVKEVESVTEDVSLEPLTDYSKYKALCEEILLHYQSPSFTTVVVRPATVCGYSPRQRFDLVVNILTNHAINRGIIKVFGGKQKRPSIHIQDMVDAYLMLLEFPKEVIGGKVYNVGYENKTILELAHIVRRAVRLSNAILKVVPTDDNRSYHISSEKIAEELGFYPKHTIDEAIHDLERAFWRGCFTDPLNNSLYHNVKRMQEIELR